MGEGKGVVFHGAGRTDHIPGQTTCSGVADQYNWTQFFLREKKEEKHKIGRCGGIWVELKEGKEYD